MEDDFRSSRKRNRNLVAAVGIVAGLALIGVVLFFWIGAGGEGARPNAVAEIEQKRGKVWINRGAKTFEYEHEPGYLVEAGDILRTHGDATLVIDYLDDTARIEFLPDSIGQIFSSEGGKRVQMSGGTARFTVEGEQPEGEPMELDSNNASATVLGPGTYTITILPLGTRFEAEGGRLRVRRLADARTHEVAPGESYVCKPEKSQEKIEFGNIETDF
jgi:hypothetical protein